MKNTILLFLLTFIGVVQADTTNCQNLYVGRIWVEKGTGLKGVVYLNNRGDGSGSWWSYFNGWTPDEKKDALAMLMAAKVSNHRVNVNTENTDGCGIKTGFTNTESVYLTTNP